MRRLPRRGAAPPDGHVDGKAAVAGAFASAGVWEGTVGNHHMRLMVMLAVVLVSCGPSGGSGGGRSGRRDQRTDDRRGHPLRLCQSGSTLIRRYDQVGMRSTTGLH